MKWNRKWKWKWKWKWSRLAAALGLLAGGFTVHSVIPSLYHKHRNPAVLRRTGVPRTVMLTFDDGPDPDYTGRLLDLLKKEEVKAAFFVVTREAVKEEALIDRMLSEGHVVGFHSMDHQNAMVRGYLHTRKDFRTGSEFMKRKGISDIWYRPPWGLTNLFSWHFVRRLGEGSHGRLDPEEVSEPCKGRIHPLSSRRRKTHGRRARSSGEDAGSAYLCDPRVKRGGLPVYTSFGSCIQVEDCHISDFQI